MNNTRASRGRSANDAPRSPMNSRANILQFAKFASGGVLNTGIDFAVFFALHRGLAIVYGWAQLVAYLSGVLNSYLLNRFWTFKKAGKGKPAEAFKFLLVNVAS